MIKDTTAALLTNAMQDVVTKGTATDAQLNNMPASGKSGTTSDNRDFWFEGFIIPVVSGWVTMVTRKCLKEAGTIISRSGLRS